MDTNSSSSAVSNTAVDSSAAPNKICRIVIQQCLESTLKFDTNDEPVSIGKGMVVFVCFLHGASLDRVSSIVKSVVNVKLSEPESDGDGARRKSVLDCNYDILVIPQATLGGKLKGNTTQYHGLVSKDLGLELFNSFVNTIKQYKDSNGWAGKVECGVYGARQILNMNTNGPFTHIFEF